MRLVPIVVSFAVACGATPRAPAPARDNKSLVLAFYQLALNDRHPAEAFAQYAAADFVEHSQDSPGGTTQATIDFLSGLFTKSPQGRWEVVRAIAEGELVSLHVRYIPAPGGPEIAIVEIFRVHDGKLAEHWDVISGPPDTVVNLRSRF